MLTTILPRQADNTFPGHRIAIALFALFTVRAFSGSLTHMFTADGGAQSIASMPLDDYPTGAAENIITVFAIAGLYQLLTALFNVVVLVRYRSLIPLMYLFFVLEYVLRIAKPLYTPGGEIESTPPGYWLDRALLPVLLVSFVLSIWNPTTGRRRIDRRARREGAHLAKPAAQTPKIVRARTHG